MPQAYRPKGHVYPDPKVLGQAIDAPRKAERPMIMGGSAIYWAEAHEDLKEFAENLNAPVFLNAMGRGSLSQEEPLFFNCSRRVAPRRPTPSWSSARRWTFGWRTASALMPRPRSSRSTRTWRSWDAIATCRSRSSRTHGRSFGRSTPSYPMEGWTTSRGWTSFASRRTRRARRWRSGWPATASRSHPLRLCAEVANFVDENTIIVGDGGDIVSHASKILPVNLPGQWYDPGPFGTLGVGTGFCMAINSVYPDKRIIMVNGDGAFGLNGFDFDTLVRFNIPVVSVVGNDRQWGQIAVGQKAMYGTPDGSEHARRQLPLRQDRRGHGRPRRVRREAGGHPACDPTRPRQREARVCKRDHGPGAAGHYGRLRVHVGNSECAPCASYSSSAL